MQWRTFIGLPRRSFGEAIADPRDRRPHLRFSEHLHLRRTPNLPGEDPTVPPDTLPTQGASQARPGR